MDDPSSHPEQFPTEKSQEEERKRLFKILEDLVVWENSNNEKVLAAAKAEIMKSTNGNPPPLLDPFAGGGAIPLEAQRLGLEAHAHDLNPVAVLINKAMIEIPPRFAGMKPVNPISRSQLHSNDDYKGAKGLAEDIRYYGEWMKKEAFKRIGHLYPTVKIQTNTGKKDANVIAWIWARTVKCPNPACGCEAPLIRSLDLSTKKGHEAHLEITQNSEGRLLYNVYSGKSSSNNGTIGRRGATCIACGTPIGFPYIRDEGKAKRMKSKLVAIVAEGEHNRLYFNPDERQLLVAQVNKPEDYPDAKLPNNPRNFNTPIYGLDNFSDHFTNRQLLMLTTFCDIFSCITKQIESDAQKAGVLVDNTSLADGGEGNKAYGEAICVYLSFVIDKIADYHSSVCSWHISKELIRNTFGRQALPMTWDYAEANPFCSSSGSFSNMLEWVVKVVENMSVRTSGYANQFNAMQDCGLRNVAISTDPPYYDNIVYADLADFFYIWLRKSLSKIYPDICRTILVPKAEELVATQYRFGGDIQKAKEFFETGMLKTCQNLYTYSRDDIPITIYYAYKQNETEEAESTIQTTSSGWETMLAAIIKAGFSITGTWPMNTEMDTRQIASGANALASSIVLVCRKRATNAPSCTRRNFIAELKRELRPALKKLQAANIAPVDMAQSAIGPGMAVFSKYTQVLEADGTPMTIRSALQIINQELDIYFNEQDGELDKESRFCVELYSQNAFNDMKFGDADNLARAKNTAVAILASAGVLYAAKGIVHLLERTEIPQKVSSRDKMIWLLTQQLTHAMETGGIVACATMIASIVGSNAEYAKSLAYRLFQIAEHKGWTQEALAYNNLVTSWPEIQSKAAEIQASKPVQLTLFDD